MEYDEKALLMRIAQGDEEAFSHVFHQYRNKIYSIAFDLTDSTRISEEIVQDVFLKIWLKRASLCEVRSFRAYLFTIARNLVFTALRKSIRRERMESPGLQDAPDFYYSSEDQVLDKEYNALLKHAVNRLPAQQQQVYILMKEQGYKRDQVAVLLHLSPETIKTHLAQAMKSIRAYCLAHLEALLWLILPFVHKK